MTAITFIVRDFRGIYSTVEHPTDPALACKAARGDAREAVRRGSKWAQVTAVWGDNPEREVLYIKS